MVNGLANSVKRPRQAPTRPADPDGGALYTRDRGRKYVNQSERGRFLAEAETLPPFYALFALLLAWTGARISEVLALRRSSFDMDECKVTLVTLKRRKFAIREVPIPERLMRRLDVFFSLRVAQRDPALAAGRLWPFSRVFAWQIIKDVMARADIHGAQACPKGLRHGAAVAMLQRGVSLHLIKRLLGHSRLSTTEIYLDVSGPEERELLAGFWQDAPSLNGLAHAFLALMSWLVLIWHEWARHMPVVVRAPPKRRATLLRR